MSGQFTYKYLLQSFILFPTGKYLLEFRIKILLSNKKYVLFVNAHQNYIITVKEHGVMSEKMSKSAIKIKTSRTLILFYRISGLDTALFVLTTERMSLLVLYVECPITVDCIIPHKVLVKS